jgi:RND family efflux transporter MFP subunit
MAIKTVKRRDAFTFVRLFMIFCMLLSESSLAQTAVNDIAVHLQGIVMPAQKIKLSFAQSGIIKALAGNGSMVEAGAVLGRIDDNKVRAQLKQGIAQHRLAISELASVTHDREKSARLVAENILSEVALLEADFSVEIAKQRLVVAQAQLELAETALVECVVTAPFKGAVMEKKASVGEWVNVGDPFMEFVDLAVLTLSIDIPPEMIRGLGLGLTTSVLDKGRVVGQAKVKTIFPMIDPASGLRRVIWQVLPINNALLTGRYVSLARWPPVAKELQQGGQ